MVKNLNQRYTFLWIVLQQLFNKIFIVRFTRRTKTNLALCNFLRNLYRVFASKRSVTMVELIEKDAKTPYIQGVIMGFILQHFGCHVFQSSTKSGARHIILGVLYTPTKVAYFEAEPSLFLIRVIGNFSFLIGT